MDKIFRVPSLQALQALIHVADSSSFTEAARQLHLTQSAISRQVQQLEEHYGVALFDRTSRKVALTEQGRIGRSQGCPAVRPEIARRVIDKLKGGQFMYSWYPDRSLVKASPYLNCQPRQVARILAANGG